MRDCVYGHCLSSRVKYTTVQYMHGTKRRSEKTIHFNAHTNTASSIHWKLVSMILCQSDRAHINAIHSFAHIKHKHSLPVIAAQSRSMQLSHETKWLISSSFASCCCCFFFFFLSSLPPSEYFPFHFHCINFFFASSFLLFFFCASFLTMTKTTTENKNVCVFFGIRMLQSTIFCYLWARTLHTCTGRLDEKNAII